MPIALSSLTKQQKQLIVYTVCAVLALAASVMMLLDAGRRKAEAATAIADVEQKELQAASIHIPSPEEMDRRAQLEGELQSALISDDMVPQFIQEVSRIASQNGLQPGISTENKPISLSQPPSPDEIRLMNAGIEGYLAVTITFSGGYPNAANFLSGVADLHWASEFKTIDMRRSPPSVDVTVVMHVYKRAG
jgi:Tfp pilus assembly protein PilO